MSVKVKNSNRKRRSKKRLAFYIKHYNLEGQFVGLICTKCYQWKECGHEDDCPVPVLTKTVRKLKEL